MGVQIDILHPHGSGQGIHVPVVNGPPHGGNISGPGLVAEGFPGVVIIIHHHQIVQPQGHRHKGQQP